MRQSAIVAIHARDRGDAPEDLARFRNVVRGILNTARSIGLLGEQEYEELCNKPIEKMTPLDVSRLRGWLSSFYHVLLEQHP